jgi:hypothetical protein
MSSAGTRPALTARPSLSARVAVYTIKNAIVVDQYPENSPYAYPALTLTLCPDSPNDKLDGQSQVTLTWQYLPSSKPVLGEHEAYQSKTFTIGNYVQCESIWQIPTVRYSTGTGEALSTHYKVVIVLERTPQNGYQPKTNSVRLYRSKDFRQPLTSLQIRSEPACLTKVQDMPKIARIRGIQRVSESSSVGTVPPGGAGFAIQGSWPRPPEGTVYRLHLLPYSGTGGGWSNGSRIVLVKPAGITPVPPQANIPPEWSGMLLALDVESQIGKTPAAKSSTHTWRYSTPTKKKDGIHEFFDLMEAKQVLPGYVRCETIWQVPRVLYELNQDS